MTTQKWGQSCPWRTFECTLHLDLTSRTPKDTNRRSQLWEYTPTEQESILPLLVLVKTFFPLGWYSRVSCVWSRWRYAREIIVSTYVSKCDFLFLKHYTPFPSFIRTMMKLIWSFFLFSNSFEPKIVLFWFQRTWIGECMDANVTRISYW